MAGNGPVTLIDSTQSTGAALLSTGFQPKIRTDSQYPRNEPDLSQPDRTRSAEGLGSEGPFFGQGGERDTGHMEKGIVQGETKAFGSANCQRRHVYVPNDNNSLNGSLNGLTSLSVQQNRYIESDTSTQQCGRS